MLQRYLSEMSFRSDYLSLQKRTPGDSRGCRPRLHGHGGTFQVRVPMFPVHDFTVVLSVGLMTFTNTPIFLHRFCPLYAYIIGLREHILPSIGPKLHVGPSNLGLQ